MQVKMPAPAEAGGLELGRGYAHNQMKLKAGAGGCNLPRQGGYQEVESMTQTTSRLFDEMARLMTDAAGAAQGVRKEVEGIMRAQAEKILRELDTVSREEFEAVREMAQKAREENEALAARIAELEAGKKPTAKAKPAPAAKPARKTTARKTTAGKAKATAPRKAGTRKAGPGA